MSGLEVAGVVLGAIPLLISALEHYGDSIRTMKNISKTNYAMIFDDYSAQLAASIGIYMNTCYELLGPLNLPDSQMRALISERRLDAWSNPDLQAALKVRLGDNHHSYSALQNQLNQRIVLLCKKLQLNENGQPPWIDLSGGVDDKARKKFFKSFWLRSRGSFNADKYGILVAAIDRDLDKLSKLTQAANRLEPVKIAKKNKLQSAYWQNVRDRAQRLFDSLSSRLSPCACTHPHQANLRLDIRKDHGIEENLTRFAFLLTFEKHSQSTSFPPWDWRDIEIESLQVTETAVQIATHCAQTQGKKTVHFAPALVVSSPSQSVIPPSVSSNVSAKIDSLCQVLIATHSKDCCLGMLEDESWQHHVYSVTGPASKAQISEAASLEDIIHSRKRIAPRQKCMLALTLASSVLQLYDTPWLPRAWETKDILFFKCHDGKLIPSQFYVSQTFNSASQAATAAARRRRIVKNEIIFALGVALLELAHGASILSLKESVDFDDHGNEDILTEFATADRLAEELHNYESENYAWAVRRCIRCEFDTFKFDLNDREFREAFYQAVVVPLQEDYEYATGGKR